MELDTLLNIDGKGHTQPETVVAKSARPSVLDSLKRPVPPRSPDKKPKQHEQGNRKISRRIKRPPSQCTGIEMAVGIFIMV